MSAAAVPVTPAVTATPTVASDSAGQDAVRSVARPVRRPPSNRTIASDDRADRVGRLKVVELDAAEAVLAGQHAEREKDQQQRGADARGDDAGEDAEQD